MHVQHDRLTVRWHACQSCTLIPMVIDLRLKVCVTALAVSGIVAPTTCNSSSVSDWRHVAVHLFESLVLHLHPLGILWWVLESNVV